MPRAERYTLYDRFAWYYTRGWSADFHAQFRHVLDGSEFPPLAPGARVLDLCCGAGDLSAELVQRGFRVTGLDGSSRMLAFARRRAPEARFLLADARSFELDSSFDAVLSTFDSLNHILTIEELETAFRNVCRALVDGGSFVFDMNMQECFETLWHGSYSTVDATSASITRGSYDPQERRGKADITVFRKRKRAWLRADVTVFERCYSEAELLDALARAGFSQARACTAAQAGMCGDVALGRAIFFAIR